MGLDITAYRNLKKNPSPDLNDDGHNEDGLYLHVTRDVYDFSSAFGQGQPSGLTPATFYDYDDTLGFRAGSYGGYNEWRRKLARLGGFEQIQAVWDKPPPNGPFLELINFADNEGVIGPVVSAKLAKDFADFRERAEAYSGEDPWFLQLYCKWQEAFEMAADNGAVEFH